MSGTSVDGVDAVVCRFDQGQFRRAEAHHFVAFPDALRDTLLRLQQDPRAALTLHALASLDQAVADTYVEALKPLAARFDLAGIGMHGQTVFHDPGELGTSLQLGNPHRVAAALRCPVVADFRRADIAAGGQGAPLVPSFHRAAFFEPGCDLSVVNLGGIANITRLHAHGDIDGFDLGPGNALMDAWAQQQLGRPLDAGGEWAASGQLIPDLLDALRSDPWLAMPPPRSTGRDHFNLSWVDQRAPGWRTRPAADVQRTFAELTAALVIEAVSAHRGGLLLCGGGTQNQLVTRLIGAGLPDREVADTGSRGIDPQWVEAAAFAWLAHERYDRRHSGLPAVTGALGAAAQGVVALPPA